VDEDRTVDEDRAVNEDRTVDDERTVDDDRTVDEERTVDEDLIVEEGRIVDVRVLVWRVEERAEDDEEPVQVPNADLQPVPQYAEVLPQYPY
jgi:hypothetical protein